MFFFPFSLLTANMNHDGRGNEWARLEVARLGRSEWPSLDLVSLCSGQEKEEKSRLLRSDHIGGDTRLHCIVRIHDLRVVGNRNIRTTYT